MEGRSLTIRSGNTSQITAVSVEKITGRGSSPEPAKDAERRLLFLNRFSTGRTTVRSARRGSGRLRRLREHAGVRASVYILDECQILAALLPGVPGEQEE